MDSLVSVGCGIIAGILAHVITPGEGQGGWVGDQAVGIFGGLLGGYIIQTINMGHSLNNYMFWVAAVSFGAAVGMFVVVRPLTTAERD